MLAQAPGCPARASARRLWNQEIEDEAQWLAGALLLTEDAVL
jgi:hypothetical protein